MCGTAYIVRVELKYKHRCVFRTLVCFVNGAYYAVAWPTGGSSAPTLRS